MNSENLLFHALAQIILILVTARGCGWIARRVGQPQVVGEMVAGVLLGPTLFGALFPSLFQSLFDPASLQPLSILSQIGLILLMFQIGLEFDFSHLHLDSNRRVVWHVCLAGLLLPAFLGAGFGWVSHRTFSPTVSMPVYVLFVAVALSITAMPVLGRIMQELNLTRTRLGTLTLTSAAFGDVVGWLLLAVVIALARAETVVSTLVWRLAGFAAFLIVTWYFIRPLLAREARKAARSDDLPFLGLLVAILFGFGLITGQIGLHTIFGGFWLGILLHAEPEFVAWWRQRAAGFVTMFFVPVFFMFTGLRTNIPGLGSWENWAWGAGLIALAMIGKFGGCWWAGRRAGLTDPEARCVAIMMNTRGMLELVVASLGCELHLIPQSVFTMLVMMALLSTVLTVPCLRAWLPHASSSTN